MLAWSAATGSSAHAAHSQRAARSPISPSPAPDDEGRIVVLDPRIVSKGYGRKFLDALPAGVRLEYGDQDDRDEMILDMDEWIP